VVERYDARRPEGSVNQVPVIDDHMRGAAAINEGSRVCERTDVRTELFLHRRFLFRGLVVCGGIGPTCRSVFEEGQALQHQLWS
jgi:hypothetical protein